MQISSIQRNWRNTSKEIGNQFQNNGRDTFDITQINGTRNRSICLVVCNPQLAIAVCTPAHDARIIQKYARMSSSSCKLNDSYKDVNKVRFRIYPMQGCLMMKSYLKMISRMHASYERENQS